MTGEPKNFCRTDAGYIKVPVGPGAYRLELDPAVRIAREKEQISLGARALSIIGPDHAWTEDQKKSLGRYLGLARGFVRRQKEARGSGMYTGLYTKGHSEAAHRLDKALARLHGTLDDLMGDPSIGTPAQLPATLCSDLDRLHDDLLWYRGRVAEVANANLIGTKPRNHAGRLAARKAADLLERFGQPLTVAKKNAESGRPASQFIQLAALIYGEETGLFEACRHVKRARIAKTE